MNDERTTAYLLNELTQREAEQFEEECFAQLEWPGTELDAAEDDLIQAYIQNELTPERRRRFEENYLTTQARKERLLFARAFLQVACSAVDPAKVTWSQRLISLFRPRAFTPRYVIPRLAGILLVIGLAATLALVALRTKSPQTFAHLNLAISSDTRAVGSQAQKVRLPIREDALKVSLTLPEFEPEGVTYRVQWEDVKGPLADLDIMQREAKSISVVIPADELKQGSYALKLFRKNSNGTEERVQGNYLFNVE